MAITRTNGSASLVVLVVEDEFLVRLEIVEHLGNSGWIVLEADTADQAMAMCRDARTVDVLVTDINLNGSGSGLDVAEALRAGQPGIGVVYVSADAVDQSRRVADSLFFRKPYHPEDILKACGDVAESAHCSRHFTPLVPD